MKNIEKKGLNEIIEQAIDRLNDGFSGYGCDLHNEVYNSDYFIIGRWQSEQWLIANYGIFNAIDKIKEYEESNFGEVNTNLSESEHVTNMLVYIIGEEVLCESEHLQKKWNVQLSEKDCKKIAKELKKLIE